MKRIINYLRAGLASASIIVSMFAVAVVPQVALAQGPADVIKTGVDGAGGADAKPLKEYIKQIVNTLLFVLGAIAVIVIVVGGIKYTTSDGDPGKIKGAKDTILYAVVGIIVAILAYAIVNFIIDSLQ